jgi:hypothetical protein
LAVVPGAKDIDSVNIALFGSERPHLYWCRLTTPFRGTVATCKPSRSELQMAFLYTFTGLTVGGMAWMAIWVGCSQSTYAALNVAAEWLSPMTVSGWVAFVVLSVMCSWITYRVIRPKTSNEESGR